jgi:cysteine-rich repeat protein
MAVALGASALALAGPAGADTKASIACRGAIAKGLSGIPNSGFKLNDKCHKTQDKVSAATGACNDVSNSLFDPKAQYAKAKTKSSDLISKKCLPGDPVLSNYDGTNPETAAEPVIDDAVGGNSALVVGNANLNGDKAKTKCVEAIGKARTAIFKEIVKNSTKCQGNLDKTASTFGALDSSCVDPGAKSVAKAALKIPEACGSLMGADAGACDPLPTCVSDASVMSAQGIAKAIYQKVTPVLCGNGTVEGDEQCDDGAANGTPGDLCNTKCESLAETCGPGTDAGGTIIGQRSVTVGLHIPDKNGSAQKLAGVRVGFDYPQLEASIKGTGLSSVVQTSFQVLQNSPSGFLALANDTDTEAQFIVSSSDAFIDSTSGAFLQVTLDECTPLSTNICNRNQQVTGCCPTTDIVACNAAPDDPVACFCGANGKISQADCNTAGCTLGVCVGIPPGNPGDCVSGKCSPTSANPGKTCTSANEALTCSGVAVDQATCTASHECSRLGDQTNGTYGCASIFNPPGAPNGSFPVPGPVGPPTVPPALPGSCPTGNTCTDQAQLTEASCTVTQPVDNFGQIVDGVTCSISVTEAP